MKSVVVVIFNHSQSTENNNRVNTYDEKICRRTIGDFILLPYGGDELKILTWTITATKSNTIPTYLLIVRNKASITARLSR